MFLNQDKRRVLYSGQGIYNRTNKNIKTSMFFKHSKQITLQAKSNRYPNVKRNLFRMFEKKKKKKTICFSTEEFKTSI